MQAPFWQQPVGQLVASQPQWPPAQRCPALHTVPQLPQLLESVLRLTQLPLQLVYVLLQVKPQIPPLQVAVPLAGAEQTAKHLPQLAGSVLVLTHLVPHSLVPLGHWHLPWLQICPLRQVFPQEPQLVRLVCVLRQLPPQQEVPLLHAVAQVPQWPLLVWRLTQVPEQLVVPAGQGQTPPVQVPEQQGLLALHAAPAATHLLVPLVVVAGVGVSAAASFSEGNRAPATPAARILRTFRRESGVASLRARSSNCSLLMLASRPG
jgi:hypothetical protein